MIQCSPYAFTEIKKRIDQQNPQKEMCRLPFWIQSLEDCTIPSEWIDSHTRNIYVPVLVLPVQVLANVLDIETLPLNFGSIIQNGTSSTGTSVVVRTAEMQPNLIRYITTFESLLFFHCERSYVESAHSELKLARDELRHRPDFLQYLQDRIGNILEFITFAKSQGIFSKCLSYNLCLSLYTEALDEYVVDD